MRIPADKRGIRRLLTYLLGGGLSVTLLVLATAGLVGTAASAQGYDSSGSGYGAGYGAGGGLGAGSGGLGAGSGTLGAAVGSPNTGVGMLLFTALFLVAVGLVVLGLTAVLSRRQQG